MSQALCPLSNGPSSRFDRPECVFHSLSTAQVEPDCIVTVSRNPKNLTMPPRKRDTRLDEVLEALRVMREEMEELKQGRARPDDTADERQLEVEGGAAAKETHREAGSELKELVVELKQALGKLKEGRDVGRGDGPKEEVLTAHAVAKRWSKWVDYVMAGDSESACVSRIDLLVQEIRVQFDISKLAVGGLMEGMAEPAIDGIVALLTGVVRGSIDQDVVGPALEAFGKQLTTAQRVETHSADSAVALAAAMRSESAAEPDVQQAIAAMPAGLRVPRWRAMKDLRRAGRWQQSAVLRGGRGGPPMPIKRARPWEEQRLFRGKEELQRVGQDRRPGNGVGGVGRA